MPNTNCKQAKPSEKATQVCVCALPLALSWVFAIFVRWDVGRMLARVCICVILAEFVFPKPLRQSASHFLEDDFPGFLPPVPPSLCPASCGEPRLLLSSVLLYSWNCRIRMWIAKHIGLKWGEIGRKEWKTRQLWPSVGSFQNAKRLYRRRQSVICFIVAQQTLGLQRWLFFIYFGIHTECPNTS